MIVLTEPVVRRSVATVVNVNTRQKLQPIIGSATSGVLKGHPLTPVVVEVLRLNVEGVLPVRRCHETPACAAGAPVAVRPFSKSGVFGRRISGTIRHNFTGDTTQRYFRVTQDILASHLQLGEFTHLHTPTIVDGHAHRVIGRPENAGRCHATQFRGLRSGPRERREILSRDRQRARINV